MGDMSLPPDYPTIPTGVYDEMRLIKLARQIAMGIKNTGEILFDNGLDFKDFEAIKKIPLFKRVLEEEVKAWGAADNVHNRLQLKSAAMLEEFLPELYARLNDVKEPLMGKIKALENLAKLAQAPGFNGNEAQVSFNPGDRVQVVINLGADTTNYTKILPHKVIDHEPGAQKHAQVTQEDFTRAFEASIETNIEESVDASAD